MVSVALVRRMESKDLTGKRTLEQRLEAVWEESWLREGTGCQAEGSASVKPCSRNRLQSGVSE